MSFFRSFRRDTMRDLMEMLTYARPHRSIHEQEFVNRFVKPVAPDHDNFGNHYRWIAGAPIIWSCHTDTVHHKPGRQNIIRDGGGIVSLKHKKAGKCLGADDAAGVWILSEMIHAKVPGLYIFHRGEEKGGLGSRHIATTSKDFLKQFKFAIAFDRKGKDSIITYQMGRRCCSEEFCEDFSRRLGTELGYYQDNTGVFTDTANYMDIIPECTNISVGYNREHGPTETLDSFHIKRVRDAMVTIDLEGLKTYRDPSKKEYKIYKTYVYKNNQPVTKPVAGITSLIDKKEEEPPLETLEDFAAEYPNLAAILLEEAGYKMEDFTAILTKPKSN